MEQQSTQSKIGEITYRAKITAQHLGKNCEIINEPGSAEFQKTLKNKLNETNQLFRKLQEEGHLLSPFLEIGSEHCLRPALLEENFKARGFAIDISLYSLINAPAYIKQFKMKKVPKRICADANLLPFKSNSFPFIFVYETLHHFPNPKPILKEIYRVLSPGGLCLIGSDPIKQEFQISLWNRPTKLRIWEKMLKKILILPFISHIGKTEIEHGIVETAFNLKTWQDSLSAFNKAAVTIRAYPFGPQETLTKTINKVWLKPKLSTRIALYLLGGGLNGLCFKKGILAQKFSKNLDSLLICPNCLNNKNKEISLRKIKKSHTCPICKTLYQQKNYVYILLEDKLKKEVLNA